MDPIVRALAIYVFLQVLVRLSGRRTLGEMTAFDFVLVLIISEATQQGLLGEDYSVTNSFILIATMVGFDILLSYLKQWSPFLARWLDGQPAIIVEDGKVLNDRLKKARIDIDDILEAARTRYGIAHFSGIKHAILEKSGEISIIPRKEVVAN